MGIEASLANEGNGQRYVMRNAMKCRDIHPVSFSKLLYVLCIAAVCLFQTTTNVMAQNNKTDAGSVSIDLQIVDGVFTGHIDNQPLVQVLDTISRQMVFEYHGEDDLLNQPVSGNFDGVPFFDALGALLTPFKYSLIESQDLKEPSRLYLQSLKEELTTPGQVSGESSSPAKQLTEEEQRLLFEVAKEDRRPPPELLDQFEPLQQPGTEKTGPLVPSNVAVEDLPEFEMVENQTGPESPDSQISDDVVTGFQPFVSETGPVIKDTL